MGSAQNHRRSSALRTVLTQTTTTMKRLLFLVATVLGVACQPNPSDDPTLQTLDLARGGESVPAMVVPDYALDLTAPVCRTGGNWQSLGPNSVPDPLVNEGRSTATGIGRIVSVLPHPDDPTLNRLYAGSANAGLFYTENAQSAKPTWRELTANSRLPILGVQSIAAHGRNLYIATGIDGPWRTFRYGTGIYRSTDGGANWEPTVRAYDQYAPNDRTICQQLDPDPRDPLRMFAICGNRFYETRDGWRTEREVPLRGTNNRTVSRDDDADSALRELVRHPTNPDVLYLAQDDYKGGDGGARLLVSRDGGASWMSVPATRMAGEERGRKITALNIGVTPAAPDRVVLSGVVNKERQIVILRSDDAGRTWLPPVEPIRCGANDYYKNALVVSPTDPETFYVGEVQTFKTTDGGKTWRVVTRHVWNEEYTHVDTRFLSIFNRNGQDVLLAGNDGGVGFSDDSGATWRDLSGVGMGVTQTYKLDVARDYSNLGGGMHDMGFAMYRPDATTWIKPSPNEDNTGVAFHPLAPDTVIGTTFFSSMKRSVDGGRRWATLNRGLSKNYDPENRPLLMLPSGRAYVGHEQVYVLDPGATVWRPLGRLPTDGKNDIYALAVGPEERTIYAGFGNVSSHPTHRLFRSTDGGTTWRDLTANVREFLDYSGGGITDLALDPTDPDRLWITLDRHHRKYKVIGSEDGGRTWRSLSEGLPDYPVNAIVYQPGTRDVLYVGTDVGVFRHPDGGRPELPWDCFNGELPVAPVTDLVVNNCGGGLVASTFGRGFWRTDLPRLQAVQQVIEGTETWTQPRVLEHSLRLERGAELHLRADVHVADGCSVTVARGAKLYLEGGRLRGLCDEDWDGLVVVGKVLE